MKIIGIPRALLYYEYGVFWETFFQEVGLDCLLSPPTNRDILARGSQIAIDEACLSSKVFMGHVCWLIGKCDAIFLPRLAGYADGDRVCTKYLALCDLVRNTFRAEQVQLIEWNVDPKNKDSEFKAFMKFGKTLGIKKTICARAYLIAKKAWRMQIFAKEEALRRSAETNGLKILLLGHSYNLEDGLFGKPITEYLAKNRVTVLNATSVNEGDALLASKEVSGLIPWRCNKKLAGAAQLYRDTVDGMILISAFPCGPDSLVNEIIQSRMRNIPTLNLIIDGQDGTAGLETRLESFLDILTMRRQSERGPA